MQDYGGDTEKRLEMSGAQALVREAYNKLKELKPEEALEDLDNALRVNFEHKEALYALNCLNWWLEKMKNLEAFRDPYSKGAFLLSQWKGYYGFLDRMGEQFDSCQYAVRRFVYSLALQNYREVLEDGTMRHDPELLLHVGRCYKGVGDYEKALLYLKQAYQYRKEDGRAISELADVYALIGEAKASKGLFREAFYIDPLSVDIQSLESDMIRRLAENVAKQGFSGDELLERIGVYGSLLGVFSAKRELKLSELAKLKQSVFLLENEVRTNTGNKNVLVPRLINKYLWLMDYYENEKDSSSLIEEIKLKIKIIEPSVYERFMR
jgi:tetratricopeptide (TPR) repeat protein